MECTKCHQIKDIPPRRRWCRECKNEYEQKRRKNQTDEKKQENLAKNRDYYQRKRNEVEHKEIIVDNNISKICTVCKMSKTIDNFHLSKNKGTIRAMCKSCSSLKRKEYYRNNKEAVIEQTSNYIVEKMKRDPIFKLERRIRTRIYHAFKAQSKKKENRTWKYIGCTSAIFQKWIAYQLYDGMTLENYGKIWHIDHVIPCSKFDLSKQEEVDKCFNWKNLRPLLATKNREKYDKIEQYDIVLQELKVFCFIRDTE